MCDFGRTTAPPHARYGPELLFQKSLRWGWRTCIYPDLPFIQNTEFIHVILIILYVLYLGIWTVDRGAQFKDVASANKTSTEVDRVYSSPKMQAFAVYRAFIFMLVLQALIVDHSVWFYVGKATCVYTSKPSASS